MVGMTMLEPGRLDLPRATLVIDGVHHGRAHLWGDGHTFHAEDVNGQLLGSLTIRDDADGNRTVERLDAKTMIFTGTDGETWSVTREGCGCGG